MHRVTRRNCLTGATGIVATLAAAPAPDVEPHMPGLVRFHNG